MPGFVYFLRAPVMAMTRIGHTKDDPALRFRRLAATNACPIEAVATMAGPKSLETETHTRFAASWSHGEWFRDSEDLAEFIRANATPWEAPRLKFRRSLPVVPRPRAVPGPPAVEPPAEVPPAEVREDPKVIRWARTYTITHYGMRKTVAEWARVTGLTATMIRWRFLGPVSRAEAEAHDRAVADWLDENIHLMPEVYRRAFARIRPEAAVPRP